MRTSDLRVPGARRAAATAFAACAAACIALTGCGMPAPGSGQELVLSGAAQTTTWFPEEDGRQIRITLTVDVRGSTLRGLDVIVSGETGTDVPEPPAVVVVGHPEATLAPVGAATRIRFAGPGMKDGSLVDLEVRAPDSAPSPFRVRLVPHVYDAAAPGAAK